MKKEKLLTDLTDEQCEKVVGGVGEGDGAGAGIKGWSGGQAAPFTAGAKGLSLAGTVSGQGFAPNGMMHGGVRVVHPK